VKLAALGSSRLIGVDTPEVFGGAECFGSEASTHTKRRLEPGEHVLYTLGVEETDRYERALVYLWTEGGAFFNAELVTRGYAVPLTIAPNDRYAGLFDGLAERAERAERGLWSACGGDPDRPVDGGGDGTAAEGGAGTGGAAGAAAAGGGRCDRNYSGCVPPYPPDVDCADVEGPIEVRGSDPHRLDGDGDGRACDS
jgi:micrococcal nuclease